jgi:hypothetical protein
MIARRDVPFVTQRTDANDSTEGRPFRETQLDEMSNDSTEDVLSENAN